MLHICVAFQGCQDSTKEEPETKIYDISLMYWMNIRIYDLDIKKVQT